MGLLRRGPIEAAAAPVFDRQARRHDPLGDAPGDVAIPEPPREKTTRKGIAGTRDIDDPLSSGAPGVLVVAVEIQEQSAPFCPFEDEQPKPVAADPAERRRWVIGKPQIIFSGKQSVDLGQRLPPTVGGVNADQFKGIERKKCCWRRAGDPAGQFELAFQWHRREMDSTSGGPGRGEIS